jgi:hypothetical protein
MSRPGSRKETVDFTASSNGIWRQFLLLLWSLFGFVHAVAAVLMDLIKKRLELEHRDASDEGVGRCSETVAFVHDSACVCGNTTSSCTKGRERFFDDERSSSTRRSLVLVKSGEKQRLYAVRVGHNLGIYYSWDACCKEVGGYSRNVYKSFRTLTEAQRYLGRNTF